MRLTLISEAVGAALPRATIETMARHFWDRVCVGMRNTGTDLKGFYKEIPVETMAGVTIPIDFVFRMVKIGKSQRKPGFYKEVIEQDGAASLKDFAGTVVLRALIDVETAPDLPTLMGYFDWQKWKSRVAQIVDHELGHIQRGSKLFRYDWSRMRQNPNSRRPVTKHQYPMVLPGEFDANAHSAVAYYRSLSEEERQNLSYTDLMRNGAEIALPIFLSSRRWREKFIRRLWREGVRLGRI